MSPRQNADCDIWHPGFHHTCLPFHSPALNQASLVKLLSAMARRVGVVFGAAVLVLVVLAGVCSSAYAKDDLPADAKLRIGELDDHASWHACTMMLKLINHQQHMPGVKHRPDDCPRKSSKGDMLSMHYTGTFNTAQALDTQH